MRSWACSSSCPSAFARGLAVIEAFDRARAPLSLTEVAKRAGFDRAVARRMLLTLVELGYVTETQRHYQLTARVLRKTTQQPDDGSTHWSCRKMASALGLSKSTVQRIWRQARIKPHRLDRYMASDDPNFEQKAADIIALYMKPPQHAALFCVDEKSAIQALDRLDPVLPLSPGRAERHGFEYYRHGTLSLYAALDVKTGRVVGKTAPRHTSTEFVDFLEEVVATAKWAREIHIVLDNLSAHKTKTVEEFLAAHPKVRFHFTPTYSSWLNQVEIWFSKIERDVIARGVFTSVADLARKPQIHPRLRQVS